MSAGRHIKYINILLLCQLQILVEMYFFSKALCQIMPLHDDIYSLFEMSNEIATDRTPS